ncbi:MAG: sulfatase [Candidatus Dormibacteria bacterium]
MTTTPGAGKPNDQAADQMPRNVIVILLDSLNRHMLGAYGGHEFATPNLDRLAARCIRFDKHYSGSLPCIPARHDLLSGALDFFWKPWGSMEIWETSITGALRIAGITTKLISDHPHLFETGGENYHTDFTAWDYQRGHETDPWRTRPDPSWVGAPMFRATQNSYPYDRSRGYFRGEADFPGPRTMQAAARWLKDEAPAHDRFFLLVDEFDPHEPFDTPEPYASLYDEDWDGDHLVWPPYSVRTLEDKILTPRQAHQVRACYGGKLTMIDEYLGRVLDALNEGNLWENTAVFVLTDHGHYLGEKDLFGKPPSPLFQTIAHIPLLVAWPGMATGIVTGLTTTVDIAASVLDIFGTSVSHRTHGHSVVPLILGQQDMVREFLLSGMWGHEVHIIDGAGKYARAPRGDNTPLSLWSNRWSTMPIPWVPELKLLPPDDRAYLDRMPGSRVPVIRQPYQAGDMLPFWAARRVFDGDHLYDLKQDPHEEQNLAGSASEKDWADRLRQAMIEVEAPDDQFVRLGLE